MMRNSAERSKPPSGGIDPAYRTQQRLAQRVDQRRARAVGARRDPAQDDVQEQREDVEVQDRPDQRHEHDRKRTAPGVKIHG